MIGVLAGPQDAAAAAEFFELFKTRWEFYRPGQSYDVLLSAVEPGVADRGARLTVHYGGRARAGEAAGMVESQPADARGRMVTHSAGRMPLYGESVVFHQPNGPSLVSVTRSGGSQVARVGYDLFREVHWLLTEGQPAHHASCPTLDLHIALLRDLIVASGASCPELPAAPQGYRFLVALTHDVDHPSIRRHGFDHTVIGFLLRAVFGSLYRLMTGRLGVREALHNWSAALQLPLVQLGLGRDFWLDFTAYPALEAGRRSTFFVLPQARRPGRQGTGQAPAYRAAAYGAADIGPQLETLRGHGCEIALHGIDAWCDETEARREREELQGVTRQRPGGVRMHWLYFGPDSPAVLDRAGFDYDSTVGYNETVGYRAGTAQVYRPLGATHLLELPLILMDTALFYPGHLNLTPQQAWGRVTQLVENATRFGGCLTVNWHDRSLAPERQWGGFYRDLVQYLEAQGGWITTAAEAVDWFRKRRQTDLRQAAGTPEIQVFRQA